MIPLTLNELMTIADWWPDEPRILANILEVSEFKEDSTIVAEDQCADIIRIWMKKTDFNQLEKLIKLLERNEYFFPKELF